MRLTVIFIILLLLASCQPKLAGSAKRILHRFANPTMTQRLPAPGSHDLDIAGHRVTLRIPASTVNGWILILPGWNFSRLDWCDKTDLCEIAMSMGFGLVLPEMGKSIYADQYYPESRSDWTTFPTRTWLRDTCIPFLQDSFAILLPGQRNFILGLSTGARGVALLLEDTGSLFRAGAMLSGDFDQRTMPEDNLMNGIYGSIQDFPERWAGKDNPQIRIPELKVPVYIAHGEKDSIVPFSQSESFVTEIRTMHPELLLLWHPDPDAGHDYAFWGAHTLPVLRFFQSVP